MTDLREGWTECRLGDLLREPLRNGHSARATTDGTGIRTLSLSAVTNRDFSESNTKLAAADSSRVRDLWLAEDDILIERSNTPELVGTAALFNGPDGFAIFPDLLIRVRLSAVSVPQYIEYVLRSSEGRAYFRERAQGSSGTMPKIDQSTIEGFPVPLPPLAEQHRIVERVEALLTKVNILLDRLGVGAAKVRDIKASALRHCIRRAPANQVPLAELGRWVSGGTPNRSERDYWEGGTIPWVSPKDMKRDFLDGAQERITQLAVERSAARVLPPGCVLVVVRGMILAHSFPVAVNRVPVAVNQDIRALIPRDGVDAEFVMRTLQANRITALERVKEATHGTLRLESDDLFSIEINLPSEDAQRRIAGQVEGVLHVLRNADERIGSALRKCVSLTPSILTKALAGELVPTEATLARREGRSYEPASVLLDRLSRELTDMRASTVIGKRRNTCPGVRSRRA